jgi:nucleotide-binding universal stress UspA family protein
MTDTNATSQPTRILVATDFSSVSDAALVSASGMAKHYGARLGVSHVAPGVGAIHPAFPSLAKREIVELGEIERRASEAVLSHTKQVLGLGEKDLDVLVAATTGRNEAETISEQARDYKADLVVVGSHGRTGLSRAWLGSVAEKVVRSAPCDVLVARPVKEKGGPVLASVDLGESSGAVLRVAAREAAHRKVDLIALFALDAPNDVLPYGMLGPFGIYVAPPDPQGHDELREAAEKTLRAAMEAADVRAQVTIVDGRATQEIVTLAENKGASLIVCATHGRKGISRLALGSVAEAVVRHSPCSVLVVRS